LTTKKITTYPEYFRKNFLICLTDMASNMMTGICGNKLD